MHTTLHNLMSLLQHNDVPIYACKNFQVVLIDLSIYHLETKRMQCRDHLDYMKKVTIIVIFYRLIII